jgi:unsaturated chondroitin disaccharide hydrolase
MFRGLMFYLAGARAYELSGKQELYTLGMRAASTMMEMFREDLACIPIGLNIKVKASKLSVGPATAIDNCFICLLPIWWRWRQTRDERCLHIARAQLETTRTQLIREDGFTWQLLEFPNNRFGYQSLRPDTCWARGQAWAIAGFALACEFDPDPRWEETLERLLSFYFAHADGVPRFDLLVSEGPRDTSAAAIIACALTRLRRPEATRILADLQNYITPDGRLLQGCFNYRDGTDINNELIWGNYYLLETCLKEEWRS